MASPYLYLLAYLMHMLPVIIMLLVCFWATICKMVLPMLSDCCLCLSVCLVTLVYCGQTIGWIKIPLGTEEGIGSGDCVRLGPSSPTESGTAASPLSAHFALARSPISATAELLFKITVYC